MNKLSQNPRINVGYSRKLSDREYGSVEYHCSISEDVIDGEDIQTKIDSLFIVVTANVKQKIINFKKQLAKKDKKNE